MVELNRFTKIDSKIYSTGEIKTGYKGASIPEQSLIVETHSGLTVITGCAHPGITNILEEVKKDISTKKIHFVLGGFHLMNEDIRLIKLIVENFKYMGVEKVGPTHCTGKDAEKIFKNISW